MLKDNNMKSIHIDTSKEFVLTPNNDNSNIPIGDVITDITKGDIVFTHEMANELIREDVIIRAGKISKEEIIKVFNKNGLMGIYNLGLEKMYDYLKEKYGF